MAIDYVLYRCWSGDATPEKRGPDPYDDLLYIGLSWGRSKRFVEHEYDKPWWHEVDTITLEHGFTSPKELADAERSAIQTEKPRYNVANVAPPKKRYRYDGVPRSSRPKSQAVAERNEKIRSLRFNSDGSVRYTVRELCEMFGVSRGVVNNALNWS
jgi:hypothetical protein